MINICKKIFVLVIIINSITTSNADVLATSLETSEAKETTSEERNSSQETKMPSELMESMPVFEGVKGSYIVDGLNGQILYSQEADQQVEVGSFSQLLLLYMVYQAIDQGQLNSQQEVWISDDVYELSQDYNIPNVPLRQDLPYSLSELMEAVSLNAARGAALALAEELAGTESKALQQMKDQLNEWGEKEFNLINVTGLSEDYQSGDSSTINQGKTNQMTAKTVATVAYHLINEYPECLKASQVYQKLFQADTSDAFEMTNPNLLIEESDSLYAMKDVDGLSASKTQEDGLNLVVTTQKNGLRLIVIVLGVKDEEKLYQISQELIELAQNIYRKETVIQANSPATHLNAIKVENGRENQLQLVYGEDLQLVVPIIDTAPRLVYQFTANSHVKDNQVKAPILAGTVVGQMQVDVADYHLPILQSGKGNAVEVKVANDIKEASLLQKIWSSIQKIWEQTWNSIRKFFTDLFN
ncbi:serine hydrolase [Facklamia miroungae]|uniref:serine hydrolase n=1 Tax=Facklamia miroungae TaxID=120956 RepID=UPI00117A25F2|nr:serine hydrolase [Facklamia miroungae]NKZ29477.1 D-alanyl-D-alanine carboxypeptidase [Facklamia miroungae]